MPRPIPTPGAGRYSIPSLLKFAYSPAIPIPSTSSSAASCSEQTELCEAEHIAVTGQLRTFNNRRGEGAKLVITVLAKEIELCDEPDENTVRLTGALCKEPNLRITPMGRDICDLMLAVNRRYGRSDYLPCICWGLKAREAATWMVGTQVKLEGRIQSRRYIKMTEDGPVERTAFEVSVIQAEAVIAALKTEALQ